jgi:hypothetical protein
MDQYQLILLLVGVAAVGIIAALLMLRRQRREAMPAPESPFGVSTEGEKRCPKCGMGNMWTDARCISCGTKLPG